jgi:signal transduction histidine kinase
MQRALYDLLFLILISILGVSQASAAAISKTEILEDAGRQMTLAEVWQSEKWKPFQGPPTIGYSQSRYWLRFQAAFDAGSESQDQVLKIPYTYLGSATLYQYEGSTLIKTQTQGMGIPLPTGQAEPLITGAIAFPLKAGPWMDPHYLLSIEGEFPLAAPLEILPTSDFDHSQRSRQFYLGLFFGILILAIVFNGFLGLWLRSRLYLVYSFFVLSISFLFLGHERLTVQLFWPQSPNWALYEMHFSGGLVVFFYALFVRDFLQTHIHTPKLNQAMWMAVALSSLRTIWLGFSSNQTIAVIGETAIVVCNFLILAITIFGLKQGLRSARYFFISSFIYNLSVMLFILHSSGVVAFPPLIEYAAHIGIISEVTLLSLALADRIRLNHLQLEGTILKLDAEIQSREKTEARLREQQLDVLQAEKMSALGRMAAGIAHEINNPLAIISSYAEHLLTLTKKDPLPLGKIQEIGPRIDATVQRISRIIKSMRTLARDSSQDPYAKISLNGVFQDIQSLCHERFRHHGIDLKITSVDTELSILCRSPEICQVLVNLLNNAFDALQSADAGLTVKVVEIGCEAKDGEVFISVINSGPLIPENLHDKIYEPFFTTKEIGQGTGLGLSISRTLIENHGGRLWIETREGRTCFVFSVPRWKEDHAVLQPGVEAQA